MRVLVQRVKNAEVSVSEQPVSRIGHGLLLLVGVGASDSDSDLEWMAKKIANLRIFEDDQGKMNLDIQQVKGAILSVPQFTLCADMKKGNRPGFDAAAKPHIAKECWRKFNERIRREGDIPVEEGVFGAHMDVELVNDGPVTIWIDSRAPSG